MYPPKANKWNGTEWVQRLPLEGRGNEAKKAMRLTYTEQPAVSKARWHSVLDVLRSQHLKIPASHLEHWSFSEQYTPQVSFPYILPI